MIKYFVGLGNPGIKYTDNRHNIGFMFLDYLAKKYDTSFVSKFHGSFAAINLSAKKIILFKPATYMNNSGIPLAEMLGFFKGSTDELIVVHDDLDLALARVKIKKGGSSGGHNGLTSISSQLGNDYHRLRFGIGRSSLGREGDTASSNSTLVNTMAGNYQAVSDYVLSDFRSDEKGNVDDMLKFLVQNVGLIVDNKAAVLMNYCSMNMRKYYDNIK